MAWQKLHENQFTIDPTHTKKVILSIDGGGMRGAIPIAMLAELEKQTNKKCQDMFHMVAGTSTGTIIAVGLALGMSAQELLDEVYLTKLPASFAAGSPTIFWRLLGSVAAFILKVDKDLASRVIANRFRYARKLGPFLKTLEDFSDGRYIGTLDPKNPILFATTKDVLTGETNFIVSAGKGKHKFKDWPLIAVVAASGAAPIFFESVENRYVDGGVGVYANPCLAASIEAMEYICPEIPEFHDGNVIHISLGTGYVQEFVKPSQVKKYNVFSWLQYIGLKGIDDAAIQQVFSTRSIYGLTGRMDFRRYNHCSKKIISSII
jgi:patatin-like phospholipase/acyl hydrolase